MIAHFHGLCKMLTMILHLLGDTLSLHCVIWRSMVSWIPSPLIKINLCETHFLKDLCFWNFRSKCKGHDKWRCPLGAGSHITGLFSRGHQESCSSNFKYKPRISSWNAAAKDRVVIKVKLGSCNLFYKCDVEKQQILPLYRLRLRLFNTLIAERASTEGTWFPTSKGNVRWVCNSICFLGSSLNLVYVSSVGEGGKTKKVGMKKSFVGDWVSQIFIFLYFLLFLIYKRDSLLV